MTDTLASENAGPALSDLQGLLQTLEGARVRMTPNPTFRIGNSCNIDSRNADSTSMSWINRYRAIKAGLGSIDRLVIHRNNDGLPDLLDDNSVLLAWRQSMSLLYRAHLAISVVVLVAYLPVKD